MRFLGVSVDLFRLWVSQPAKTKPPRHRDLYRRIHQEQFDRADF